MESVAETKDLWWCINFSGLGFIGKLLRSRDLNMFISVFLIFADIKPIDIIFDNLIEMLVCDLYKPKVSQFRFDYLSFYAQQMRIISF